MWGKSRSGAGRRLWLVLLIPVLMWVNTLPGCGGDDPHDPDGGGPTEEILLSSATAGDWSAIVVHHFVDASGCTPDTERITDVNEILSNGTFRVRTNSVWSGTCCVKEDYTCSITTTRLLDFSPFKTARLKAEVRMFLQKPGLGCAVDVIVYLCGTQLIQEHVCGDDFGVVVTKDIDLNIGDLLDCVRGSLDLSIRVGGACQGSSPSEVYAEVRNLRIVVTR